MDEESKQVIANGKELLLTVREYQILRLLFSPYLFKIPLVIPSAFAYNILIFYS